MTELKIHLRSKNEPEYLETQAGKMKGKIHMLFPYKNIEIFIAVFYLIERKSILYVIHLFVCLLVSSGEPYFSTH